MYNNKLFLSWNFYQKNLSKTINKLSYFVPSAGFLTEFSTVGCFDFVYFSTGYFIHAVSGKSDIYSNVISMKKLLDPAIL